MKKKAKQNVRLKGQLKLYMQWPALMTILLIAMMIFNNSGLKKRLLEKRAAARAEKAEAKHGKEAA